MQVLKFRDAFNILLSCGTWVTPDGTVLSPRFGDYLDCIAGETPVFMTIGITAWDIRAFSSDANPTVTVDDTGYMQLVDDRGTWWRIFANPLPPPGPSLWWPHGTPDDIDP